MISRNPLKASQVGISKGTAQELEDGVNQEGKKWSAKDLSVLKSNGAFTPKVYFSGFQVPISTTLSALNFFNYSVQYITYVNTDESLFEVKNTERDKIYLHEAGLYKIELYAVMEQKPNTSLTIEYELRHNSNKVLRDSVELRPVSGRTESRYVVTFLEIEEGDIIQVFGVKSGTTTAHGSSTINITKVY